MSDELSTTDAAPADAGASQSAADQGGQASTQQAPQGQTQQAAPTDPWGGWDWKAFNGDLAKVPEHVRPVLEHVSGHVKQQALAEHKQALDGVNAELAALKQQKAEQGGQLTARQKAEQAELIQARANLKASEDQIKRLTSEKSAFEQRAQQAEYDSQYVQAVGVVSSVRDYLIPSVMEPFVARNAVFGSEEDERNALIWAVRAYYDSPKGLRPASIERAIDMGIANFGGRMPADTTGAAAVTTSPQGGGLNPTTTLTSDRNSAVHRQMQANLH